MNSIDPYNPLDLHALGHSLLLELERHPAHPLASVPEFVGSGIYALYYRGSADPYRVLGQYNEKIPKIPIYIGRSRDTGARQGLNPFEPVTKKLLYARVAEHRRSIESVDNLRVEDFAVRVLVVMPIWIPLAEVMAIRQYQPVWNSVLQGFGIHAPGSGRQGQKMSDWDLVHPGRAFAKRLQGRATRSRAELLARLRAACSDAVGRHSLLEQDIAESRRQPPRPR
ncbi:MAG TPA: Eco29kI family restriction endonuclease [Gemmatimonadaceae bacterium]